MEAEGRGEGASGVQAGAKSVPPLPHPPDATLRLPPGRQMAVAASRAVAGATGRVRKKGATSPPQTAPLQTVWKSPPARALGKTDPGNRPTPSA